MTQSMRILIACLLIAVPCAVGPVRVAAASPAVIAQADQGETHLAGTVAGTVRDNTGAPIAGAVVTLSGPRTYTTTTDAAGRFTISDVRPAFYNLTVTKPGYDTAQEADLAVFAGEAANLVVSMHLATLTSLRTIATVHAVGQGVFNTSTASINVVTSQTFIDQGQTQVIHALNQVPGIQISFPSSSASGAVPGAITVPNIRGGASFETASLIDGHPLSVGTYGDYVTTFLNPFVFSDVEVIKGPGAMSPEVNYAIGGTVNFRTQDPTYKPTTRLFFGTDNYGGTYSDLGFSDTIANRLGFVFDYGAQTQLSAVNNRQVIIDPNGGFLGPTNTSPQLNEFNGGSLRTTVPGTSSSIQTLYPLVGCCYTVSANYNNYVELVKLQYKLSQATVVTASYLGSQTFADQNANTGNLTFGTFAPAANGGYAGPLTPGGALQVNYLHPGGADQEINNEPIFQAEVHTLLGKDTVLARFYHASIDRLINEGTSPTVPDVQYLVLNGTSCNGSAYNYKTNTCSAPVTTYNNVQVPVYFFDYYQQAEIDRLAGLSFEYDHPIHDNVISFAVDRTNSTTTSYSQSMSYGGTLNTPSVSIPTGSGQIFTTYLLRGRFQATPNVTATWSNYLNTYNSTFATACTITTCLPDGTGFTFGSSTTSHFDSRLGMEYRPRENVAVRFAAGSAIAPPYLLLLSNTGVTQARYNAAAGAALLPVSNPAIKPETAFGYDLGTSLRLHDNVTIVSGDVYLTDLFNHYFGQTTPTPYTCGTLPPGYTCSTGAPSATPIFNSSIGNISNARFEGIEASVNRLPEIGWGFSLSGALQRAYVYNLPPYFYCSVPGPGCTLNQNLNIIANQQINGGGIGFGSTIGSMNTRIPYFQANLEVQYRFRSGAFVQFGDTLFGKNNSLNEPPFGLAYATVRVPISAKLALQVSGDNIFNAYSGLFPMYGAGVPIPLVTGSQAATVGNVLGPATYRFVIVQRL